MGFDEKLFIRALMDRPADAKKYCQTFDPSWLRTVELRPVIDKVFTFTKDFSTPPSMDTLRKLFIDEDSQSYDIRYKQTIDDLDKCKLDTDSVLYCMDQAKDMAIVWSLESLFNRTDFAAMREDNEGKEVIREVQKWLTQFDGANDDVELRIGDAIQKLIKERGWENYNTDIPTGIEFLDDWCGGGLRPRQLGLILAPTGGGKSMALMVMAYKMSLIMGKRVLFISNELSMNEVTERFGALIAGQDMNTVQREPSVIKAGMERLQKLGIQDRLYLAEVNRDISTNDIEAMMKRYIDLYGWSPEVVIVDYMERMKPTVTDVKRDKVWDWFGAIASDLVRFAKRTNTLVWTAGQTNRGGLSSENEQSMAQAQGSIKHMQECSAVIAMRQRGDLKTDNDHVKILEFRALKMRHSKRDDTSLLVEVDLGKMLITRNYHSKDEWKDNKDTKDLPDGAPEEKKGGRGRTRVKIEP